MHKFSKLQQIIIFLIRWAFKHFIAASSYAASEEFKREGFEVLEVVELSPVNGKAVTYIKTPGGNGWRVVGNAISPNTGRVLNMMKELERRHQKEVEGLQRQIDTLFNEVVRVK